MRKHMWGIFVIRKCNIHKKILEHTLEIVVVIFLLSVAVWSRVGEGRASVIDWPAGEREWEGVIVQTSAQGTDMQKAWVELVEGQRVEVKFSRWPRLLVGTPIAWTCRMRSFKRDQGPWQAWRARHGLIGQCQSYMPPRSLPADDPQIVFRSSGSFSSLTHSKLTANHLSRLAARTRLFFATQVRRALPEPHASLVTGMLFGEVSTTPEPVKDTMQKAGLIHLVAVSGGNVAWVVLAISMVWKVVGGAWRLMPWVSAVCIGLFVLLAGGEASAIRAACMACLQLWAQVTGRMVGAGRLLMLAMAFMVLLQPRLLLGDPGFQLSCAATAALLWLAPWLQARQPWMPERAGIAQAWSASLAATIGTFPIGLWWFGATQWLAPFANVLAAPAVPVVMLGGAGGLGLSLIPFLRWLAIPFWLLAWLGAEWVRVIAAIFGN